MYYSIRLRKIFHDGRLDSSTRVRWTFRSLRQALAMLSQALGQNAETWRIDDLTGRTADIMKLEGTLQAALESGDMTLIMTFMDGAPELEQYDHYEFVFLSEDEASGFEAYSFSEEEEASFSAWKPNLQQTINAVLKSFDISGKFDRACVISNAFKAILECYDSQNDIPTGIRKLMDKTSFTTEDYVRLADETSTCGEEEEQLAAALYAAGYYARGDAEKRGEALVKLAELYMDSRWPKTGGREYDVMIAVDLLTEAVALGRTEDAKNALIDLRERTLCEYEDEPGIEECEDGPDVDFFIDNFSGDALCLVGFCFGVGIGCKKDLESARRLFEAALDKGYARAAVYLNEIQSGRI